MELSFHGCENDARVLSLFFEEGEELSWFQNTDALVFFQIEQVLQSSVVWSHFVGQNEPRLPVISTYGFPRYFVSRRNDGKSGAIAQTTASLRSP